MQKLQKCLKRQLSSTADAVENLEQNHANANVNCSEQNPVCIKQLNNCMIQSGLARFFMNFISNVVLFDFNFQENHSSKHVGDYYTVPKDIVSTLFSHGLPKSAFLDEVEACMGICVSSGLVLQAEVT